MANLLESARVAFTGKMASMCRREAWRLVLENGGEPDSHVSHYTTMLVVGMEGWPLLPDGGISHKLKRAEELREAGCRIQIVAEPAFLELIGRVQPAATPPKTFPSCEVCRVLRIDAETLLRWEQFGLVRSCDGNFDFQDLRSIQTIRDLVRGGVRPEKIARSLRDLAAILPAMDRPLAQLRIIADNPGVLHVDSGGAQFSPTGQFLLDFEGKDRRGGVVLSIGNEDQSVEVWFDLGKAFEEEGLYPEAASAFRAALTLDPRFPPAHIHLGHALREMGFLWAAEESYLTAVRLEPCAVTHWCFLGGVQEQQGKFADAILSYEAALAASPDYADAHFCLALCFEKAGRELDARRQWFNYLKLDPASASAQVARQHLSVGSHV